MITVPVIKELIIGVRVKTLHKSTSTEIYSVLISEDHNKPNVIYKICLMTMKLSHCAIEQCPIS